MLTALDNNIKIISILFVLDSFTENLLMTKSILVTYFMGEPQVHIEEEECI